jgi:hypothetical protein
MESHEINKEYLEKRINAFLDVAKNIANSKECKWPNRLKDDDNFWGAYGELLTAYFLREELQLELSQLKWIEKKCNEPTPDLEIIFYDDESNCDNKILCEIATIATAKSIPDGFSSRNIIEQKIGRSLRPKTSQLQQNYANIFVVVIPPNIVPGIWDHSSLVTPLLGQLMISDYISPKTESILSSKFYRDGTISHRNDKQAYASIFAIDKLCDILSAVIFIQDITLSKAHHKSKAFIITNSQAKHAVPLGFYRKFIETNQFYFDTASGKNNLQE